jgi:glycolate oxidase iron-sulfur subunit
VTGLPEDVRVTEARPPEPCPPHTALDLAALADQCVQCGLCLPACPTYALEPLETESPRGRIALAKAWETGLAAPTAAGERHLDHCLGCRRCEDICPAKVDYGTILNHARAQQRQRRGAGWRQRAAETLAANARLRRPLLALYRHVWPWLPAALRPLPRPQPAEHPATRTGANTDALIPVSVFTGCVAEHYEGPARAALTRLLAALGMRASFDDPSLCCGALHAHGGDLDRASSLEQGVVRAFGDAQRVLSLASGCHDALAKNLGRERVVDALAFLADHADRLRFMPRRERIALHLPCTQRNLVKSDTALRGLLARIPELDIVVLDAGFGCCGAAGTHMLTEPERAARFREPLLTQFAASGATRLLSANIGCRLHLANGTALPVQHPLEFLDTCLMRCV